MESLCDAVSGVARRGNAGVVKPGLAMRGVALRGVAMQASYGPEQHVQVWSGLAMLEWHGDAVYSSAGYCNAVMARRVRFRLRSFQDWRGRAMQAMR